MLLSVVRGWCLWCVVIFCDVVVMVCDVLKSVILVMCVYVVFGVCYFFMV